MDKIRKILGKVKSQSETEENPYQTQQLAAQLREEYLRAERELRPRTYAEKWLVTIRALRAVQKTYPLFSIGLSLFFGVGVAYFVTPAPSGLSGWGSFAGTLLICVALALLIEAMRPNAFKSAFIAGGSSLLLAGFLTLASISLSAGGGYIIGIKINDNTTQIKSSFKAERDSVKAKYQKLMAVEESLISSAQEVLSSKLRSRDYRKVQARADITEASGKLKELNTELDSKLSTFGDSEEAALIKDFSSANKSAGGWAGIVLIMELLILFAYGFEVGYMKKVRAENRANNFVNFEPELNIKELNESRESYSSITPQPAPIIAQNKPSIGFAFSPPEMKNQMGAVSGLTGDVVHKTQENAGRKTETETGYLITCKTCGAKATKKRENAKFCSDSCRNKYHNSKD